MNKYIYSLSNYHAIDKAEIIIDGITVLAGENGCGKSTLSRWLYYLVNGAVDFERFLYREYVEAVQEIVRRWNLVSRDVSRYSSDLHNMRRGIQVVAEQLEQLYKLDRFETDNIERVKELFMQALTALAEQLYSYLKNDASELRKRRVASFLNIEMDDSVSLEEVIGKFQMIHENLIQKKVDVLSVCLQNRTIKDFYQIIRDEYNEKDNPPVELQFKEEGVELLEEGCLANIYNLRQAIYVDTPMAATSDGNDNVFWNELRDMMLSSSEKNISVEVKLLIKRIKLLLGGEAKLMKDEKFGIQELRYVSEGEDVDIELSKVATGMKTFAYLQRLLQNGYLNEQTLLLIDEPEAHLHPQWIVEYARLLVWINKKIGTKIMIASHNPDMVSALRAIAEKECILENTHFYLAEKHNAGHRYVYNDLGHSIEDIFRSFNIALDRIKLYGADSI